MIVVAYNKTKLNDDVYAKEASKARYGIGVRSVRDLAEQLDSGYKDHSITTLIIADHGAGGIQGVGSGQSADFSFGTNLSAEHITVSSKTLGAEPAIGQNGSDAGTMMWNLLRLGKDGFASRNQADHISVIARKVKPRGNLLLAGCSVASNEDGKSLLKSLGLALQNSIRVVGCVCESSWTDVTKPILYPAKYKSGTNNPPRLTPADVVGYMGMRPLSDDELQSVLDATDILSTGV